MDVTKAMELVQSHVAKHSDNKYQHTILNTEGALRECKFTLLTANKYMARYLAVNGEKQANPQDLLKAVHFLLFEIQTRFEKDLIDNLPIV